MSPERWRQIKSILAEAREHPRAGRREWLAEACGDDRELLADVESFLEHEDQLEGFIEEPVLSFVAAAADDLDELEAGRRIGPYRLVRLLGQGGMGAVYLAERQEDYEQQVALKLVRRSLVSRGTVRRFHAERQILARLDHPNIARLLDGGTTEEGVPYFAMELIEGVPIDRYCDEHRLTTRERLELFVQVCSALELAHQSLVVHRDLKPGNILVDASGTPKLLDFGIAKLLAAEGAAGAAATQTGQQAMTLRYASPEQIKGEPIGTASDIYSLGVVLYKVLTGHLPYDLEDRNQVERMVAVCEEDPLPPSVVVGRDGGASRTPRRRLAGDVDSIVAKALRKEPRQRYASAAQLAADLRRHLDGLPVAARQGKAAYRTAKFVRRHRVGLAAVAAIVLLAVGFTAALVRQLRQTEKARDRAEGVSSFVIDLFQAAAPDRPAGEEPTVRDLLDRGRRELETGLEREDAVRATLSLKMGEVYAKLGGYAEARELLTEAIELLRRQHAGDHPDLAAALNDLAVVDYSIGELEGAEELFRECIAMRRRLSLDGDLVKPMNNLAALLMARGDFRGAEETYRQSLELRRAIKGERHPNVAVSLRSLATALYAAGDFDAAEPLLRQSLDIRLEVYGPESPKVAMTLASLGRVEHARGRFDEAEALYSQTLDIRRRKLGEEHLHTALAKKDLAALLLDLGETAAARVILEGALATLYRILPEGNRYIAEAESLLGVYLAARGFSAEAEVCLVEAHATLERQRGPQATDTRAARRRLDEFHAR